MDSTEQQLQVLQTSDHKSEIIYWQDFYIEQDGLLQLNLQ